MTDEEIIDKVLKQAVEFMPNPRWGKSYMEKNDIVMLEWCRIKQIMELQELIIWQPNDPNQSVILQPKGYDAAKQGYIKWIKHNQKIKEAEYSRTIWQSQLAKWQGKTFWWLFGFSIVGIILSIAAIIISLNKK